MLDGLPKSLPALLKAYRIQEIASRSGFDRDDPQQVLDRVAGDTEELRQSLRRCEKRRRKQDVEHGPADLFFALVNLSRRLKIDPESALTKTNHR